MTRVQLVLICATLAVLALLGGPRSVQAQADRAVAWERYDVALTLRPDSTVDVVETQRIRFTGTYRRGFREIPFRRLGSITEVSVEEPGRPYRAGLNQDGVFSVGRDDGQLRIDWWFPETTNATRTFILRYRVSGLVRVYDAGDQIFWQAIYADRPGPVQAARVTVHLPSDVTASAIKVEGTPRDRVVRAALDDPRTLAVEARDLPAASPLEVHVQFPHGLVPASPPSWQLNADRADWYQASGRPLVNVAALLLSVAIPSLGGVWLAMTWFSRGRDPDVKDLPGRMDEPPSDLPPGVVGTLVDEHAEVKDVIATLVDLGQRGLVRIEPLPSAADPTQVSDYRIHRNTSRPPKLEAFEKAVLTAVAGSGQPRLLSSLKGTFSAKIPLIQQQLYRVAVHQGWFDEDPDKIRRRYMVMGIVMAVGAIIGLVLGVVLFDLVAELLFLPFVMLAVLAAAVIVVGRSMPRRSRVGALEAARWKAFGRGLAARGEPTPGQVDPEHQQFGRYLPYAIALGVEHDWLKRYERLGVPSPAWYGAETPILIGLPDQGWGSARRSDDSASPVDASETAASAGAPDFADGLQHTSDALAQLFNAASEALSSGASSSDSGGGWSGGGGDSGGSSGGGSGGFD